WGKQTREEPLLWIPAVGSGRSGPAQGAQGRRAVPSPAASFSFQPAFSCQAGEGGSKDARNRSRRGASLPCRLPSTPANDRRPGKGPALSSRVGVFLVPSHSSCPNARRARQRICLFFDSLAKSVQ